MAAGRSAGSPKRKAAGTGDTRSHILDAAARLYSRNGIVATSMREIAKECGIQAGSVYNHFESKDQITAEIFRLGISRVADMVNDAIAAADGADFRTLLSVAIMAHLKAFLEYGDYTATHIRNFKQAPANIQAGSIKSRDAYEKIWVRLLDRGVAAGALSKQVDLHLARLLLFGSLNWTLEWFRPSGKYSLKDVADMTAQMFLEGFGKADARSRYLDRPVGRRSSNGSASKTLLSR